MESALMRAPESRLIHRICAGAGIGIGTLVLVFLVVLLVVVLFGGSRRPLLGRRRDLGPSVARRAAVSSIARRGAGFSQGCQGGERSEYR